MRIDILSLFPGYFKGPFDESIVKRAREKGLLDINLIDIRDFVTGPATAGGYKRVDDRPYGGGPGMVMMAEPIVKAIRSVKRPNSTVIYLSPQAKVLTAAKCRELSSREHIVLLCGHYEGVDERCLKEVDETISIGDYVLTNGCPAAIIVVEAVGRFIPGVLGHPDAASKDSFEKSIFDHPHYTGPAVFEGEPVPEVLLSGNHGKIAEWQLATALENTRRNRPDLLKSYEN